MDWRCACVLALIGIGGCGGDETCGASAACGSKTYQSCCSGGDCRFKVSDGKSFACAGMTCDSARAATLAYCSGKAPPETCTPDGKTVALAAKYAVQAKLLVGVKVTSGCSGASCLVDTDADAELLMLGSVTQNGTAATVTVEPCDITLPSVALKGQTMPLRLSVPADQKLLTTFKPITASGALDSTMTCAKFDSQPITIVLGANLADPNDPLPGFTRGGMPPVKACAGSAATACLTRTTAAPTETGCVCDQDGDGKLGATLDARNVPGVDVDKLYLDLRTSITLTGQVFPPATTQVSPGPRIKGTVTGLKLDEKIVGCHLASPAPGECGDLETNTAAVLNPAITQSVNGDSTFAAVPLAGDATCQTVKDGRTTLFQ